MKKIFIREKELMKKIFSIILIVTIMISYLQIKVNADDTLKFSVSMSVTNPIIGNEFEVNIKMDNYSQYAQEIRGLQIDVNNIDSDVLSVVSHNSLIDDTTAASNKTSYSTSKEYIRLVYLSISGTLDKTAENVMSFKLKLNEDLEGTGQIVLPITYKIGTKSENITQEYSLVIDYVEKNCCTVSIDGKSEIVEADSMYTLPETENFGYYANGKMYKPGATVSIASHMEFTSVNKLTVNILEGASIRMSVPTGLKFQVKADSDNILALSDQNIINTGLLITTNDLYKNDGSELNFECDYIKINIKNQGWYKDKIGSYCGSIVNITKDNYFREFISRAYITINYSDGTTRTIYSDISSVRSINYVANAVKNDGYRGLSEEEIAVIDTFLN